MKIFIYNLIPLLFFSFACNSSKTKVPSKIQWSETIFHYQTGSVPPPYYYSYDITINTAGGLTLIYKPGYSDTLKTLQYEQHLTSDDIKRLNESIINTGILDGEIEPAVKTPIGGPLQNVRVVVTESGVDRVKSFQSPNFPKDPDIKAKLEALYTMIKGFVNRSTWDELEKMRNEKNK